MSEDERRWGAEDDARTLRRAQEIQSDKSRVKDAHKVIEKELNALTSVAKKIGSTTTSKAKTTSKKKTTTKKK